MGLLDELQNEVRQIRAREARKNVELAAQDEFYRTDLRPVMLRAYEYYAQVIENLNIVAPEIKVGYPLNPLLEREIVLQQANYKFRSDNKETPHQIDIFCRCTLEAPLEFFVPGQKSAQGHAELLDNYNFPYHRKNRLDRNHHIRGATFILDGPMIPHVRIAANPADRNIHIIFRNIESKPLNRYLFSPEAVDDELLERVAKVFLRQLPVLVDRTVDASFRDQLRSQIERDKHELAQTYAVGAAELTAEKNTRLIGRTKSTVVERARDVLKYFSDDEG